MTWPHPLTHPSTQPPTHPHPPMGGSVSTNHKSSNRIELSWFSQQFSNFKWFDLIPPINPPTHQIIQLPMGGRVSTDFKSSNRIEISWLVQVLLNFEWFQGSPWGVGMGVGGGERVHPIHMHMHVHAHACMYDIIGNSQGFPQWGRPFAWNYHVYHACMCMCVHACMRVHVHMSGGTPTTPTPKHPPPPPRAAGNRKHQNSITLELIEIIRFCLKILYLWTFLNSYRL